MTDDFYDGFSWGVSVGSWLTIACLLALVWSMTPSRRHLTTRARPGAIPRG